MIDKLGLRLDIYMKPKLLTTANHDIVLNLGYDYGVYCFWNTPEAAIKNK